MSRDLFSLGRDGSRPTYNRTADYDQKNGALQHRIANGVGVLLTTHAEIERGGFGILDNGASSRLDAQSEEGAFLTVEDEDDFVGLLIKNAHTCKRCFIRK